MERAGWATVRSDRGSRQGRRRLLRYDAGMHSSTLSTTPPDRPSGIDSADHLPYAIAMAERDQWLRCLAWAIQDTGMPHGLKERFPLSFFDTADGMRNKPD